MLNANLTNDEVDGLMQEAMAEIRDGNYSDISIIHNGNKFISASEESAQEAWYNILGIVNVVVQMSISTHLLLRNVYV